MKTTEVQIIAIAHVPVTVTQQRLLASVLRATEEQIAAVLGETSAVEFVDVFPTDAAVRAALRSGVPA